MNDFLPPLRRLKSFLFYVLVTVFPIFFLPLTRDFLVISKLYFFFYLVIAILVALFLNLVILKKIKWIPNPFTHAFVLIILSFCLSILLMSPNKIQALYNPNFGLFVFLSFICFYFIGYNHYSSGKHSLSLPFLIVIAGFIASLISIISFIEPFKLLQLPASLQFLKSNTFNPLGGQIEFIIFSLFVLIIGALEIWKLKKNAETNPQMKEIKVVYIVFTIIIGFTFLLHLYNLTRSLMFQGGNLIFPPLSVSWYAAIEVLKQPMTAIFGVGVDNFAAIFTKAKDINYNSTNLWQISHFNSSRSTFLHIVSELGLLGLTGFLLLLARIFQKFNKAKIESKILILYSLAVLLFFPPSLINWFLFFVSLILFSIDIYRKDSADIYEIDFKQVLPLYISTFVILLLLLTGITYHISRTFLSEFYFKNSLDSIQENNLIGLYENQKKAIIYNPYNEDFRINFSQTNMLVATNVGSKKPQDITKGDRQTIAQAIQAAIAEAKAAVALNPNRVNNWHYLANMYREIINVAQGAENWSVTAYQQAILLDPQNPTLRLQLGGIFYLYKNYDNAQKLFEQAIALKGDWSNAYYNLAWTLFQKQDYSGAVSAMQNVVTLLDPKKDQIDLKKAQKELEEFKTYLPTQESEADTRSQPSQARDLLLPSPPAATIEPKLKLPENASPEATIFPEQKQ